MDPERLAQLQKQFDARPKSPQMTSAIETDVIRKFKALPQDRKNIIKLAMQYPCANCEAEFKIPNTGKSHGICKRHFVEMYKEFGKTPPPTSGKSIDLSTLSPDERKLLVYLFTIVMNRQTKRGTFLSSVRS